MNPQARNKGGKVQKVMKEFGSGSLKSSSGQKVTNPKQAIAIALSEQRRAKGLKAGVNNPKTNKGKSDFTFAKGGEMATKKYARGGGIESKGKTKGKTIKMADGGMARPAVMPGRSGAVPTGRPAVAPGRPELTGLARAAQMSGRTMPTTGRPAMKKGGSVKKYARGGGIESKGKTRGKFV